MFRQSGLVQMAVGAVVVLLAWGAIAKYGQQREQSGYEQAQIAQQLAVGRAEALTRQTEYRLILEMEERERETQQNLEKVIVAERRAADERVRRVTEDYATRYSDRAATTTATAERQAADAAIRMFAELLSELDELAEAYAAEADKRREAGVACEESFMRMREALRGDVAR